MQGAGGEHTVLDAGHGPLRRGHGDRPRARPKRNLEGVRGRRRRAQFERVAAGVDQRPKHAGVVAHHRRGCAANRHVGRPPVGIARQRYGHLRQRMHGQANGQRVCVHAHLGGGDFRAARRAWLRAQQPTFQLAQQFRRRRGRRGLIGQRAEQGESAAGRHRAAPRQTQAPATSDRLEREPRREQTQRANRREAKQGDQPRRQDEQAHGAVGVQRAAPRQRVGRPLPSRDAGTGLPRPVHTMVRRLPRPSALACGLHFPLRVIDPRLAVLARGLLVRSPEIDPRRNRLAALARGRHILRQRGQHRNAPIAGHVPGEHFEQAERLRPAVRGRFQLREQGDADLRHRERHQKQQQHPESGHAIAARYAQQPPFRRHPRQGGGREQIQPRPHRRPRLVVAEQQRHERDHGNHAAEQARRREGDDEQHKEVKQPPAAGQAGRRVVHSKRRQQFGARRQIQRRRHGFEARAPTDNRHGAAGVDAPVRAQVQLRAGHFHAGARVFGGHQQALAPFLGGQELVRTRHVQPRAGAQDAAELVRERETVAVEVLPELARERQRVLRIRLPTPTLDDGQPLAGTYAERRQVHPRGVHQAGVRGAGTLGDGVPQARVRLIAPHLEVRKIAPLGGQGDAVLHRGRARVDANPPLAGAHLHTQFAAWVEQRRQRALHRQGHKSRRQRRGERLLAHAAGHVHGEDRSQPGGHIVRHPAEDADLESILGRLGLLPLAQPKAAILHARSGDRPPIHVEGDHAARGGHRQRDRALAPDEGAGEAVAPRRQANRRGALVEHHLQAARSGRRTVSSVCRRRDLARPTALTARQRHPLRGGEDRPRLLERPALRLHRDLQAPRPGADEVIALRRRARVQKRAADMLLAIERPTAPLLQLRRHGGLRLAWRAGGNQQRDRKAHAWCPHAMCSFVCSHNQHRYQ